MPTNKSTQNPRSCFDFEVNFDSYSNNPRENASVRVDFAWIVAGRITTGTKVIIFS